MKIDQQQKITNIDVVNHHLSNSLTEGTKGKKGVAYLGKIFSNLGGMIETKWHRIATLFESGKWINNDKVMKNLLKEVKEFNTTLTTTKVSPKSIGDIKVDVGRIKAVCTILRKSGAGNLALKVESKIAKLEAAIDRVEEAIGRENTIIAQHNELQEFKTQIDKTQTSTESPQGNVTYFKDRIRVLEEQLKNAGVIKEEHARGLKSEIDVHSKLEEKEKELLAKDEAIREAKQEIMRLKAIVKDLQKIHQPPNAEHLSTKNELANAKKELAAAQVALNDIQNQTYQELTTDHVALNKERISLNKQLDEAKGQLKTAQEEEAKLKNAFGSRLLDPKKILQDRQDELKKLPTSEHKQASEHKKGKHLEAVSKKIIQHAETLKIEETRELNVRGLATTLGKEVKDVIDLAFDNPVFKKVITKSQEHVEEKKAILNQALIHLLDIVDKGVFVRDELGQWFGSFSTENQALDLFERLGKTNEPEKIFQIIVKGMIKTGKAYMGEEGKILRIPDRKLGKVYSETIRAYKALSETDYDRLNALKDSKAYALKLSVKPIVVEGVVGEAAEVVYLIRKGFEQSGQKIPSEIGTKLANIVGFAKGLKEPKPINEPRHISKVKIPEGLDKKLELHFGKPFLEDQKIKLGKHLSELVKALNEDKKFRQALGEGWLRSGDSTKLTALAEKDFSQMSLEEIEKTLKDGEALVAQAFVKMNKPLPESIKERISKLNELTKNIERRDAIVTAETKFSEKLKGERDLEVSKLKSMGLVGNRADNKHQIKKRKILVPKRMTKKIVPEGVVAPKGEEKHEAIVKKNTLRHQKEQFGAQVSELLEKARSVPGFTESLGDLWGSSSKDNSNLDKLVKQDFTKMSAKEIESNFLEISKYLEKGFKQMEDYAEDEETVAEIKRLKGDIGGLKSEMNEVYQDIKLKEDALINSVGNMDVKKERKIHHEESGAKIHSLEADSKIELRSTFSEEMDRKKQEAMLKKLDEALKELNGLCSFKHSSLNIKNPDEAKDKAFDMFEIIEEQLVENQQADWSMPIGGVIVSSEFPEIKKAYDEALRLYLSANKVKMK